MRVGAARGRHDWWVQPKSGVQQAVPRRREINEQLARHIVRMLAGELMAERGRHDGRPARRGRWGARDEWREWGEGEEGLFDRMV